MTDWTDPNNYDPDDLPPWERDKQRTERNQQRAARWKDRFMGQHSIANRIFWGVVLVGFVVYLAVNWQFAVQLLPSFAGDSKEVAAKEAKALRTASLLKGLESGQCRIKPGWIATTDEQALSDISYAAMNGQHNAVIRRLKGEGRVVALPAGSVVIQLTGGGIGIKRVQYKGVVLYINSEAAACKF